MTFYKTNLHFHTADDPEKKIKHSFYEGMDRAAELGFEIIALTCQEKIIWSEEYRSYAENKGILLVPGIEKIVEKKHVLILNPENEAEKVSTFKGLEMYKKNHPESFIIAPHPYFPLGYSLKEKLEQNIGLFDAVEFSWFYSRLVDLNKKASLIASSNNLPFITTSDTHILKFINTSYALIEAEEKTISALFEAIRKNRFKNVTSPRTFWKEMVWEVAAKKMILGIG